MSYHIESLIRAAFIGTLALAVLNILSWLPCVGWIFSLLAFIGIFVIAINYVRWSHQAGIKSDLLTSALWGGLAAALASIFPTLFSGAGNHGFILFRGFTIGIAIIVGMFGSFIFGALGAGLYGIFVDFEHESTASV